MGVLYFFFCDAAYILYTDVQAGVTGHVGVKYSNIRDIVVSCCVSPERETAFASWSLGFSHFLAAMAQ